MKTARQYLVPVIVLLSVVVCPAWAGIVIYVDDDAPLGGDGLSWDTAYRFLQDGLHSAVAGAEDAGDVEIRVAQGVYRPDRSEENPEGTGDRNVRFHFRLLDSLAVRGGYAGLNGSDPNERDVANHPTILSGDLAGNDVAVYDAQLLEDEPTRQENSRYILVIEYSTVDLDGLIVKGGHGDRSDGAGLWGFDMQGSIRDCTFTENYAYNWGGAISLQGRYIIEISDSRYSYNAGHLAASAIMASVILNRCDFYQNYSLGAGTVRSDSIVATDCTFDENRGGGVSISWNGLISGCCFKKNEGWGILSSGQTEIRDCQMVNNTSRIGSPIHCGSGNTVIKNSILAGNHTHNKGGAITVLSRVSLEMYNCTVALNRASVGSFIAADQNPSIPELCSVNVSNCIISEGSNAIWNHDASIYIENTNIGPAESDWYDSNGGIQFGPGNMDVDPCFVDPGYWDANGTVSDANDDYFVIGDHHLKSQAGHWNPNSETWIQDDVTSLCIDAGDPNIPIMHEPFPNGGVINMGAYGGTAEASKSYFGEPVCETIVAGDINGDCKVDFEDLAILMQHWTE